MQCLLGVTVCAEYGVPPVKKKKKKEPFLACHFCNNEAEVTVKYSVHRIVSQGDVAEVTRKVYDLVALGSVKLAWVD